MPISLSLNMVLSMRMQSFVGLEDTVLFPGCLRTQYCLWPHTVQVPLLQSSSLSWKLTVSSLGLNPASSHTF